MTCKIISLENLNCKMQSRLKETQNTLVFYGEVKFQCCDDGWGLNSSRKLHARLFCRPPMNEAGSFGK